MAKAHDSGSALRKLRKPWWLLVLILLPSAGVVYLDRQGTDWQQRLMALREWFSEKPPLRDVRKPIQPSELPPSFDIANADESGKLVAAGQGEAGWIIRVASETKTLGEAKADDNYEWVLTPEEPLDPGEHTLRLVEIDPVSQRSVPGERSITLSIAPRRENLRQANRSKPMQEAAHAAPAPAEPVHQPSLEQKDCNVAIVKRGDTLWGLAHHCYGDGATYSRIFESNRQQLRNPNLIYPAQQLTLPH
jgi:nucleoid-associated protein YgaU